MADSNDINWYSNDAATFGDRIAAAREARQLSIGMLGRRIGVATKTIEAWENDISEPRANKLQMLAGILNVSIPWLLTGEGEGVAPEAAETTAEVSEVMTELRTLRTDLLKTAERVGQLEKRLKTAR
jgi:transcriptional regulator with XRE-family HTH domain